MAKQTKQHKKNNTTMNTKTSTSQKASFLVAFVFILFQLCQTVSSFSLSRTSIQTIPCTNFDNQALVKNNRQALYAKEPRKKRNATQSKQNQPPRAEFEYQELRAQLTTMLKQKIRPKMLAAEKREELESYLTKILLNRPSPIPLKSLGDDRAKVLYGKWILIFSSEAATLGDLPRDATVELVLREDFKCDYKLTFAKTLGLKSITAKSTYMVDSSPVNPGLVTFVYQDIVTELFGFKNFPVGTFGLLKGRANYVESMWFDGLIWVERGYNPEGIEFFNVYMKGEEK